MSFIYRNRDGAERSFEAGEDIPAGWVPRTQFKAWRAAGFPTLDEPPGLTRGEIIADLERLDITYDKRWGPARLDALLRKDKAAREAAINEDAP